MSLKGIEFYSQSRQQQMLLVTEGHAKDWICYQHPEGQWVTLRKATEQDRSYLANAALAAHEKEIKP